MVAEGIHLSEGLRAARRDVPDASDGGPRVPVELWSLRGAVTALAEIAAYLDLRSPDGAVDGSYKGPLLTRIEDQVEDVTAGEKGV